MGWWRQANHLTTSSYRLIVIDALLRLREAERFSEWFSCLSYLICSASLSLMCFSGPEFFILPNYPSNWSWMTLHLTRLFWEGPAGGISTEVLEQRGTPGAIFLVDWSFLSWLGEMSRPWFQTSHWWHAKHTALCSLTPGADKFTEDPECLPLS